MNRFTRAEMEHLQGQHLGRLAMTNGQRDLNVVPLGFRREAIGRRKTQ